MSGNRSLDLEAHRGTEAAAHELALEREQQGLGVILFDLEILITCHAERVMLEDLHSGE